MELPQELDPRSEDADATVPSSEAGGDRDVVRVTAKATAAAIAVGAIGFGLWEVRSMVILLLLSLTFAAAIRPGVEWLNRHRVPQPAAILSFFLAVGGVIVLFFWAAVPPALHQLQHALHQHAAGGASVGESTGVRHDVLAWVERYLHQLPSGHALLHPIASYGHQATGVVVAIFFTLAATWYWVSERDRMIELLTALAPESRREKARQTFLFIDERPSSTSVNAAGKPRTASPIASPPSAARCSSSTSTSPGSACGSAWAWSAIPTVCSR